MNRISLNLATRPFRNNTLVGTVLAVGFVATIAATGYNAYAYLNFGGHYQDLQQEETQHRGKLQGLDAEERRLSKEIVARDYRRLLGRGQYADGLITRRAFSWTLLFNKLEDVVPAEVMMTAIRPEFGAKGIVIRVDGIAKNHGALISLEDALLKSPVFGSVYPVYERRVNPSRPEISFALNFDYIPVKASGGAQPVPANPVAAAGPAPKGEEESPKGTNAPAAGTEQAATAPSPAGGEAPPLTTAEIGTVGRDGRPRTAELLARVVAAPGGVYPPNPAVAPERPKAPEKKSKRKGHGSTPPSASAATTGPAAAGHPAAGGGPATREGAPRSAVGGSPVTGAVPAGLSEGAPTGTTPPAPLLLPARRDPNLGTRSTGRKPPKTAAAAHVEPVPATRLDVPLTFIGRPVGDVYAALSQAHGVRFVIDPAVDGRARITADLAGKNLKEALALLSKQAGHRVQRVEDGVYRVLPSAGGEPIADRPVTEEPLTGEGRP